jgi:hypothetical protein
VRRSSLFLAILLSCKGDNAPAPTPASGSAPEPPPAKVTNIEAPKAPGLPDRPSLGSGKSAQAVFEAESRETVWAGEAETEIKSRLKLRAGKVEAVECRQSQCRLTIAGSKTDVGKAIADLEGHRGLHGYAKNVLLTAPEEKSDGTLVLRAYALFDR